MTNNTLCWMKLNITADYWAQKTMMEKDMRWIMRTAEKAWSWKSKNWEKSLNWQEKKELDTMSYWGIINSQNNKSNSCKKNSDSTTNKFPATIWPAIHVLAKKKPNAAKLISWLKIKNTWQKKTSNWSKRTEDLRTDWTDFNKNSWVKKTDLKSIFISYWTWRLTLFLGMNRKFLVNFNNLKISTDMNWKWPKTILLTFMKNKWGSWKNQSMKRKLNYNLSQDNLSKSQENTIKWWSISEISRENLMGIWPKPEFSSESSLKNFKESTAFTSKLWQISMFTNMKMICWGKSSICWRANSTRLKPTTKIKWVG